MAKIDKVDECQRLINFKKAVIFGPIFICSCCSRKLYENGVTKIKQDLRDAINKKKPNFYSYCIPREITVNIKFNNKTEKTGFYICHTCKTALSSGKVPSMSVINGLNLSTINNDCQLTELENNLIALNINFQYIFCLQKSRWAGTKKQMISVPVTPESVQQTVEHLPRIPREAGLVGVKLKRKKIYDGHHKKEFVDPQKIIRVLKLLKKSGHPYYQFFNDFNDLNGYESRCMEQDKNGHQLIFGSESLKKNKILDNSEKTTMYTKVKVNK